MFRSTVTNTQSGIDRNFGAYDAIVDMLTSVAQPPAAKVSMIATDKTKPGQSSNTNVSRA
jgi:hypothetical protein